MKKIIALVLSALLLISTLSACAVSPTRAYTYAEATAELAALTERIKPITQSVHLDPNEMFDLDISHEMQSLPNISEYPFVVNPTTASYISVYSDDPLIAQAAVNFNNDANTINGQVVSVGLRAIPSALGTNYIVADRYTPDVLIPASKIYGDILSYKNIPNALIADTTVRNVSGVVLPTKTGITDFAELIRRVRDGDLTIGYTDPLQDPDGLNFLLAALCEFDKAQPLGETAVGGLRQLQNHISLIAYEPLQLKNAFLRGILGGYVLDYNTYKSTTEYKTDHTFIPFGVPQSSPMYTIGELSSAKAQIAQKFAEYCKNIGADESDSVITGYTSSIESSPVIAGGLNTIYRSIRGGSSSVTAVFVADTSGSMRGTAILKLKTGLRGAINVIDPGNSVGLVTFDDTVSIAVPIAPFDGEQQSYFSNAISNITDGGGTAMYDALAVTMQMLLDYQAKNPDTKLVIFVLTDGDSNRGLSFDKLKYVIGGIRIPIYTLGYESVTNSINTDTLEELAAINEASYIDAGADNVTYILSGLLGSQI